MARTVRSSLILLLIAASIIVLAFACERPTPSPTSTPLPTSTPTPEPTPEPTAIERLAWFDARPDTAHWIAWNALRRMAVDDEPLTQQIASLDWVVDGITAEEAGALDDVSWLLRENLAIADTALSLPWMATNGVIALDDRRALRVIRAAASTDENLGAVLAEYEWLTDGLTQDEAEALETIGEIVTPGFTTQTATGIGAIRLDRAGIGTPPSVSRRQLQLATSFSQLPWMQDDVTSLETVFIANLSELTGTAGSLHADAADTILSYDWVQDGVELYEPRLLLPYATLFEAAGVEDVDILPIMLEYEWTADGLRSNEARSIRSLASLLRSSSLDDAGIVRTMVNYQWLADSIDGSEYALLDEFAYLLRLEDSTGAGHRQTILGYDWLADDITLEETVAFRLTANFIGSLSLEQPEALGSLLTYEWLRDDIREDELRPIRTLTTIAEQYDDNTDEFVTALITSPWLRDEVQEKENQLLDEYESYLVYGRVPGTIVSSRLATYSWLDDGISDIEFEYVLAALDLLRDVSPTAPETITAVIGNSSADPASLEDVMTAFQGLRYVVNVSDSVYGGDLARDVTGIPWLLDGIEPLEGWWLLEYAWLLRELDGENEELARSLLSRPWARDGISPDEREWTHQYRRLLEETTGINRENAFRFADLPWFQEQIDFLAAGIMGRLAFAALHNRSLVIEDEWPDDGISESDLVLLLALLDARARSEYQYRDLRL